MKHGLGLAKTTSTKVIFFPYAYGGYGTMDLHVEYLSEQTRYIIQHVRNGDSVGKRVIISTEISQLEAGSKYSITRRGETTKLGYLTPTVLTSLMCQLWTLRAEIWLKHWIPEGSNPIMEEMRRRTKNQSQLLAINTCRTWLKVHTISDISTIDGRKIHPGYLEGHRVHRSKWEWPRWSPPKDAWTEWKSALQSYIDPKFPITKKNMTHQIQDTWTNPERTEVELHGEHYKVDMTTRRRHMTPATSPSFKHLQCDVHEMTNKIYLMPGTAEPIHEEENEEKELNFVETLIRQEPAFEYIFRRMPTRYEDQTAIADMMIQGKLVAGTDGGDNQEGRLVMAIVLSSDDLTEHHTSGHEVFGQPKDSGRAEIFGLTAAVIYLCHLMKWHGIPEENTVTIYCDNEEAVKFANNLWIGTTPKWADSRNVEIKRVLREALIKARQSIRIEHVHSHQDRGKTENELPLSARINIMCDQECTRMLSNEPAIQDPENLTSIMKETKSCLAIKGRPVTGSHREALLKCKYRPIIAKHLGMCYPTFDSIDWEGHARAIGMERSPALKRIVWGHHPTKAHLKLTGQYPTSSCPLCGEDDTSEHFIVCVKLNASPAYKTLRDKMRHQANAKGAPDHLINLISGAMIGDLSSTEHPPRFAKKIYKAQHEVGWRHFIRGRLVKKWSQVKTTDQYGRKPPDTRWRVAMMRTILQWLLQKWEIRCTLIAEPEADMEKRTLLEQCQEWWIARKEKRLLHGDTHLKQIRWKPKKTDTVDYLRAWLHTRSVAERAYQRYRPMENQPTLHRWLVRKEA